MFHLIRWQGNRILDMMSAGWTDERHMLYISSMEASFVHQLYNHGNRLHNAKGNGFKVLRRGVWEYIKYEKTNPRVLSGTKCCMPANPCIQHFRPRDCGSNAQSDGLEASVGDHESGTQTNRKRLSVSHGREWGACKGDNQLLDESTGRWLDFISLVHFSRRLKFFPVVVWTVLLSQLRHKVS